MVLPMTLLSTSIEKKTLPRVVPHDFSMIFVRGFPRPISPLLERFDVIHALQHGSLKRHLCRAFGEGVGVDLGDGSARNMRDLIHGWCPSSLAKLVYKSHNYGL